MAQAALATAAIPPMNMTPAGIVPMQVATSPIVRPRIFASVNAKTTAPWHVENAAWPNPATNNKVTDNPNQGAQRQADDGRQGNGGEADPQGQQDDLRQIAVEIEDQVQSGTNCRAEVVHLRSMALEVGGAMWRIRARPSTV